MYMNDKRAMMTVLVIGARNARARRVCREAFGRMWAVGYVPMYSQGMLAALRPGTVIVWCGRPSAVLHELGAASWRRQERGTVTGFLSKGTVTALW